MTSKTGKGARRGGATPAHLPSLGGRQAPLRDQVAEALRGAILAGRFAPGERLVEDSLAQDFGVSRNPVREALRALAAEGLVQVTARRGAAVAALEGLNARLAARRRDRALLRRLETILQRGGKAARGGRIALLTGLNGEFH